MKRLFRSAAALATLVLLACAPAWGQSAPFHLRTTCNTSRANLEYGLFASFQRTTMEDHIARMGRAYDRRHDAHAERAGAIKLASNIVSVSQIEGKRDAAEFVAFFVADQIVASIGSEYGQLVGEVALEIADVALTVAEPSPAAIVAGLASKTANLYNNYVSILDRDDYLVESSSMQVIRDVSDAYLYNCRNEAATKAALGVTATYNGASGSAFLGWLSLEYAKKTGLAGPFNLYVYREADFGGLVSSSALAAQQAATRYITQYGEGAAPEITRVSPSDLTGRPNNQTQPFTILGRGFTSTVTLLFYNTTGCAVGCPNLRPVRFIDNTTLEYDLAVGAQADNWRVEVVKAGRSSNSKPFNVRAAPDVTPPASPQGLMITPDRPTNETQFTVAWQNPTDASTIVAAYFSRGAPTSATGGTRVPLGLGNPSFPVTSQVSTTIYVWLEDAAGNVDHRTAAYVSIHRDTGPPVVTITGPTSNETHSTADATITLRGSVSDAGSSVNRMFWLSSTGASGPLTRSGSTWTASNLPLNSGGNAYAIAAVDAAGNLSYDAIGVTRTSSGGGGGGTTYTLSTSATNGTILVSPSQTAYAAGAQVTLTATPANGYAFARWEGDASGTTSPITVTMNASKSVSAVFRRELQRGSISVTITPSEAITAGARWRVNEGPWLESDEIYMVNYAGVNTTADLDITYGRATGWSAPPPIRVRLPYGESRAIVSEPFISPASSTNGQLTSSTGAQGDGLGYSVGLDGAYAALGNGNGSKASAFVRSGETWTEQRLVPSGREREYRSFGRDVAVYRGSGFPQAAVGAPRADEMGAVYVYTYISGDGWHLSRRLVPDDRQTDSYFGDDVALDDLVLVAGATIQDEGGMVNSGAAYVFRRDFSSVEVWAQQQKLLPPQPLEGAFFGHNVAVSGNVIAVAANAYPGGRVGSGAVYVYRLDGQTWRNEARLTSPDTTDEDQFGSRGNDEHVIAVRGNRLIVGARLASYDGLSQAGLVYVFEYDEQTRVWSRQAVLRPQDPVAGMAFGASVDVRGNTILVGAPGGQNNQQRTGLAYVFRQVGSGWRQAQRLTAPDGASGDRFGGTVSLADDAVLVGAPNDDVAGVTDLGSAWVLPLTPYNAPPTEPAITTPAVESAVRVEGNASSLLNVEWSPSRDPEGAYVRYLWSLASSPAGFGEPMLSSDLTDFTTYAVRYSRLTSALEAAGVEPGQTVTLYHRVTVTDGTSTTQGPVSSFRVTRGILTSMAQDEAAETFAVQSFFPNPTRGPINLSLDLPHTAPVSMQVFDMLGRRVLSVPAQSVPAGRGRRVGIDASGLSSGYYVALVSVEGAERQYSEVVRFVVLR